MLLGDNFSARLLPTYHSAGKTDESPGTEREQKDRPGPASTQPQALALSNLRAWSVLLIMTLLEPCYSKAACLGFRVYRVWGLGFRVPIEEQTGA